MVAATEPAKPETDEPRKLVGVTPALALDHRMRLLGALEQALPVRFEARESTNFAGLDAVLIVRQFDGESWPDEPNGLADACPRLVVCSQAGHSAQRSTVVEFARDVCVARPLRGRKLTEEYGPAPSAPNPTEGDAVLAATDEKAVWWCQADAVWTHFSAFAPEELGEQEALRDHLRIGRFMGLVPLLHLLRYVCEDLDWSEQPLRASFVIDDPNLHWLSYGYLKYPDMVAHATEHGYHVGLAMVPLDGWLANRRTASLITNNPSAVSVLMHGNDHVADELGRLTDDREALIVLAQALLRTAAFERRTGVAVERVMAPPHEVCSKAALRAMFRLGFDAACIGRRHPWADREPLPSRAWPLAKWHPTDMFGGCVPILPRYPIDWPWEELVFLALLGQPLILFGHHWDFADGIEMLAEATDYINGLGDVEWGPVGWIMRESFLSRREGDTMVVQMHSARITVDIPEDITLLRVTTPGSCDDQSALQLAYGADHTLMMHDGSRWMSGALRADPGTQLALALAPDQHLNPDLVHSRRSLAPWAALRRALVEGRDRVQPLARKLAS
jgi:hypothetical protein